MDFMFEDEVDEVGSDVEAYCPKCKADTTHVVISKYELVCVRQPVANIPEEARTTH